MIKIILKSFFIIKINSFLFYFLKNVKKKYSIIGPLYMPKKIEKFTFLISPHVDKNARDQVQIKYYKVFFFIKNYDTFLINFLVKNKNIDGVELRYIFL
ncbi:uS10/mL48 family ribosomal protein [Candidatus Carsonella ruddii]|uniref:30S ribosomal protein S10 n=1 Tax=Candidatus Carsonella ruddii (Diaphorina cf. continua) TaxID=2661587 RepID=A0A7R7AC47_CARRU|nr:uS10/mL48 family ribosomal protein [Candidatus Carsonella ruddii (Diaphorina cf. continua)]BCG49395.1 30S ribosomal protein S10 [Candidatus Carsonella ruddii (Diaphorina cf. continua)]